MSLNPFVWQKPIQDPMRTMGREQQAKDVANLLRSQTNIALFAPRDVGKTTFVFQVADALKYPDEESENICMSFVYINLDGAFSWEAMAVAIANGVEETENRNIRRKAQAVLATIEESLGASWKVFDGSFKRTRSASTSAREICHRLLRAIARAEDPVMVCFDEFQYLNSWAGDVREPLGLIRSTLMEEGASQVSVIFTGSIRQALELLLKNSNQPIFSQTKDIELDDITAEEVVDFLYLNFESTGKQLAEGAVRAITRLAKQHPKRTQMLAHKVWQDSKRKTIDEEMVREAYQCLMDSEANEFAAIDRMLSTGNKTEERMRRVLFMIADGHTDKLQSKTLVDLYGLEKHQYIPTALEKLRERGLVVKSHGHWIMIDPFLAGWYRERSPFGKG